MNVLDESCEIGIHSLRPHRRLQMSDINQVLEPKHSDNGTDHAKTKQHTDRDLHLQSKLHASQEEDWDRSVEKAGDDVHR